MAIDSIEDMKPPSGILDKNKWMTDNLEELEEHYRTILHSYVPHGLNVKGESNYKKWGKKSKDSAPVSSQVPLNYIPVIPQPGGISAISSQISLNYIPIIPQPGGVSAISPQVSPNYVPIVPQPRGIPSILSQVPPNYIPVVPQPGRSNVLMPPPFPTAIIPAVPQPVGRSMCQSSTSNGETPVISSSRRSSRIKAKNDLSCFRS